MTAADNPLARLADRVWLAASDKGLPSADPEFNFKAGFVAALQLPPDEPRIAEAVELARSLLTAPGVTVRKLT
jgi:hypothetical protein